MEALSRRGTCEFETPHWRVHSNHAYAPKFRQRVLELVRKKYGGPVGERFGPTLAAEHLDAEHGFLVNAETLRLWMLEAGLWSR